MLLLKGPHQREYRPLPSEEKFAHQCQVFPDANSTAGSSVLVQSRQYIYSKLNSMANQGLPLPPGRQNPPYPGSNQSSRTAVARRTPSGRYIFLSRDESELSEMMSSEMMSGELTTPNYNVYLPPTPDNQPMNQVVQQQLVPSTLFTGGFNNLTEGRVLEKVGNPAAGQLMNIFSCGMRACDGKAMRNERGEFIYPCECQFKLCNECYLEKFNSDGMCPGCKEPLKPLDMDGSKVLPMVSPKAQPKTDRRLSIMKSMKPSNTIVKREPPIPEFDHNGWLFESKGTYGYGNAVWPKDDAFVNGDGNSKPPIFSDRLKKPMSRKIKVPAKTLSPYRFLAVARFVILGLFLHWRVKHPNHDAMWLWGMSVVCEIWFAFSWLLDQLPKLCPVNRSTDLLALKERFETPGPNNPKGISDLPGIDLFVSTADPEKEPPLVTANTILSILAAEYPVEKMACYVSDDGGALLTFEALAEAASFARTWVPFCRKHDIEPRNPESYFTQKGDPTKNKLRTDFVRDRRRVKREYDEFKVRINCLPDAIRRRSDAYNANEEIKAHRAQMESGVDMAAPISVVKATWMSDGTHWPGTWVTPAKDHSRGDHAGVIQVMLPPASYELVTGGPTDQGEDLIDTTDIDIRLPMLVYVSREKRAGYDHNKKAGAMNALVRTSAIMSNGAFILNLDCDHYIYNTMALREAMCFMLDRNGGGVCYVQFPQRFEGIDASDRYANHNTVFFDSNMRALDGLQGPVYVGTGCCFRRVALYGFDPPKVKSRNCFGEKKEKKNSGKAKREAELNAMNNNENEIIGIPEDEELEAKLVPKRYGNSIAFLESIPVAEYQGRPLADIEGTKFGRPSGALIAPRQPLDAGTVAEAINVISCHFEDKTEWGDRVGWIYGSVTEDVVTGFRMHNRGWRSIYCVTKRDAFRGTAPINLTDRLHQVLRWATGSVEIFFSRNNALLGSCRLKFLQRIAYLNVGIYPFTSIFLLVYCFLPALSLFTGQFIVNKLDITYLIYLFLITIMLCLLAVLEIRWSHITLEEWWRNEQFWVIGGTSAHLAAVFQGLLKVIAGVDISFTLTSKGADEDDEFADLYLVKWSSLMIPPLTLIMTNLIAICVSVARTIYSTSPEWSKLLGGVFFSFWVLVHLYPFAKGLMGRRGRMPTIIFVWAGLLAIIISLLWVSKSSGQGSTFTFP